MSLLLHPLPFLFTFTHPTQWALSTQLLVAAICYLGFRLTQPKSQDRWAAKHPSANTQSAPWPGSTRSASSYDLGQVHQLYHQGTANTAASGLVGAEHHPSTMIRRPHPDSPLKASPPHRSEDKRKKRRNKTKTVSFAPEDQNEVHLVENWLGELNRQDRRKGHVRFYRYHAYYTVERWIEPHGRGQLHFPTTKWIRDGPDDRREDLDGDIEMLDTVHEGTSTTVESVAEAFSRVRLG